MSRPWQVSVLRCFLLLVTGAVAFATVYRQHQTASLQLNQPSQYYIDGIQYFPPGPEFKLQRAAAAMKAYKSDLDTQRAEQGPTEQTLPPASFGVNDDVVYFAPGPEFKLQREAAAMKAYKSDLEAQQAGRLAP